MMKCEICGWELEEIVWYEEAWGRPIKCIDYEDCQNPNCGEDEEE